MLKEALKDKTIKKKIIFTLTMLMIFAIGSNLPVPGMNSDTLKQIFRDDNMGLFELFNLFTGGSFKNFTIFALGITPYITASIIIQLLTIAFPYFEGLSKEDDTGRKKMASITRYLAVCLALIQGAGLSIGLFRKAIIDQSILNIIMIILILTAGTTFLMWIGEQINEYGVGNGISLLIFAGIVERIPVGVAELFVKVRNGSLSVISIVAILIATILLIAGINYVQQGIRKIPVQYAKRMVGRKLYNGENTHLPIKLNAAGVIPIIFSLSLIQFPLTITYFMPNSGVSQVVSKYLSPSGTPGVWIYILLNILLIVGFTYFYTAIIFKPSEVSKNLANAGGSIPGIRQGKATEEYLTGVMNRLCLPSAMFLAVIATIPIIVSQFTNLNLNFGGTSILIMVGVALDTVQNIENRGLQGRYTGFLR